MPTHRESSRPTLSRGTLYLPSSARVGLFAARIFRARRPTPTPKGAAAESRFLLSGGSRPQGRSPCAPYRVPWDSPPTQLGDGAYMSSRVMEPLFEPRNLGNHAGGAEPGTEARIQKKNRRAYGAPIEPRTWNLQEPTRRGVAEPEPRNPAWGRSRCWSPGQPQAYPWGQFCRHILCLSSYEML